MHVLYICIFFFIPFHARDPVETLHIGPFINYMGELVILEIYISKK